MNLENLSVRETEALRPRLRTDLRFSIQEQSGVRTCVIEDPAAARFHRVGLEEYGFLRRLDGVQTVAALLAQHALAGAGDSFTESEAVQIVHWAKSNHLLTVESDRALATREHGEKAWRAAATWLNPLSIKIPLGRPDRMFTLLEPVFRPLFGWGGAWLWFIVLVAGAAHLGPEWSRFSHESAGLLARDNWLWLFLGWLGLKVVHEFSHGLVCKHFGAPVREMGLIFILGVPMGYMDATASLGLASKWRRIAVAAAGVAAELWFAALAAIVWSRTGPGPLHTLTHNVVIAGTVLTLFFNANPLMRYDGYFILADLLELPNLSTRGRQWITRLWGWLLLGAPSWRPTPLQTRADWLVAIYGAAAWFWHLLITAGLILGASILLRGGGLLFAVIAAVGWVAVPLARFATQLRGALGAGGRGWFRLLCRTALFAILAGAALFIPWRLPISSSGVIELPETEILRAECPGFVQAVYARDGQAVTAGQVLVELRNDEAAAQMARTRLDLTEQELRARLAYTRQDVATFQAEAVKASEMRRSLEQQEAYLSTLTLRAPFAGRVTNRQLAQLSGRFFRPGEEILRIGLAAGAEVKIAVSERHEPHFRALLHRPVDVRIEGRGTALPARLIRLEARASREIAWPALTALTGGPIAVRHSEEDRATAAPENEGFELADPHFTATALIEAGPALLPGETARIRFWSTRRETLWQGARAHLEHWMQKYTSREG